MNILCDLLECTLLSTRIAASGTYLEMDRNSWRNPPLNWLAETLTIMRYTSFLLDKRFFLRHSTGPFFSYSSGLVLSKSRRNCSNWELLRSLLQRNHLIFLLMSSEEKSVSIFFYGNHWRCSFFNAIFCYTECGKLDSRTLVLPRAENAESNRSERWLASLESSFAILSTSGMNSSLRRTVDVCQSRQGG